MASPRSIGGRTSPHVSFISSCTFCPLSNCRNSGKFLDKPVTGTETVLAWLDGGGNPNAVDKRGESPLHWVCRGMPRRDARNWGGSLNDDGARGSRFFPGYNFDTSNVAGVAHILIEAGADLNAMGRGRPPLLLAAAWGQEGLVALLLDNGADIHGRDGRGLTGTLMRKAPDSSSL
ncbi:unnamed protein product [Discosporangium mesarthrocarpum]